MSQKIVTHSCARLGATMVKFLAILILSVPLCCSWVYAQTRAVLNPSTDFTYMGAFQMPAMAGSYGTSWGRGLAVRLVDSSTGQACSTAGGTCQPHLFSTTATNTGVYGLYEVIPPALSTSSSPASWNTAAVLTNWGTGLSAYANPLIDGLYWDPTSSRLYFTTGDGYFAGGSVDSSMPTLGFATFSGTTMTPQGMWGLTGTGFKSVDYGVVGVPSDFQTQFGVGTLAAGFGGYQSVESFGGVSLGPSLTAFTPPTSGTGTTSVTSAVCSSGSNAYCLSAKNLLGYPFGSGNNAWVPDHRLDDFIGESGSSCSGSNPQTFTSCPYSGTETFSYQGYSVNGNSRIAYPDGHATTIDSTTHNTVPGQAYWDEDFIQQGGAWIQTTNKEGIVYLGDFSVGRIYYSHSTIMFDGQENGWLVYSRDQAGSIVSGKLQSDVSACSSSAAPTTPCYTGSGSTSGTMEPVRTMVQFPGAPYPVSGSGPTNYLGSSSTSLTIPSTVPGSVTFTTQAQYSSSNTAGLAYTVGMQVSLNCASNGANTMTGTITSYSGTSMTVQVTSVSGSGTYSSWYITGGWSGEPSGSPYPAASGMAYDSVNQNLYVLVNFVPNTSGTTVYVYHVNDTATTGYTVTPAITSGESGYGSISPATAQTVNSGSAASFTVTPGVGYTSSVNDTCGPGGASSGSMSGGIYTTGAVKANCTVTVSFSATTMPPPGGPQLQQ